MNLRFRWFIHIGELLHDAHKHWYLETLEPMYSHVVPRWLQTLM